MSQSPLRYDRLLTELPKNNFNVTKSAKAAGFAESTANTQQKRIMKAALKHQAEKVLATVKGNADIDLKTAKKTMAEMVGLSQDDVMARLKYIADQTKDLNAALKVLGPLARQLGVVLQDEDQNKVVVPVLNVTVKENLIETTAQPSHIPEE